MIGHLNLRLHSYLSYVVDEWRKKLDVEVAELIKIPSHLSFKSTSDGRVVSSTSTIGSESSQAPTDKLHLACALFSYGGTMELFTHPEVFVRSMHNLIYPGLDELDLERTGSILDRYGIEHVAEAPDCRGCPPCYRSSPLACVSYTLLLAYVQAGTHRGKYKCSHNIEGADLQRGVHYLPLGMRHEMFTSEMVEEGGGR